VVARRRGVLVCLRGSGGAGRGSDLVAAGFRSVQVRCASSAHLVYEGGWGGFVGYDPSRLGRDGALGHWREGIRWLLGVGAAAVDWGRCFRVGGGGGREIGRGVALPASGLGGLNLV